MDAIRARHGGAHYLNPSDLQIKPLPLARVALIGSCLVERWGLSVPGHPDCAVDRFIVNNAAEMPPWDGKAYDFQVVQLPLRDVIYDASLWRIPFGSAADHEAFLEQATAKLEFHLRQRMAWNVEHGLLTFVANNMLPQRNPMGSLLPRFDLSNPEYMIEQLNARLEKAVLSYKNAFVLDLDRISASFGRRYIQDDSTDVLGHGSLLEMRPGSDVRIEPLAPMWDSYESRWLAPFAEAVWMELVGLHRAVRQADAVKLVVVDLDDTLWNGISGDLEEFDDTMAEGWPIGFLEALAFLKRRGILIAVISKNEESRIREVWPKIYRDKFKLDDFAALKINWRPKVENMREILAGMNLLPRNVVFIDDNPVERDAMKAAFPDMRLLGRHPNYLRRTLLWSPETQVAMVTQEAARRTEMIQAQLQREDKRTALTEADFYTSSAPRVTLLRIANADHPRFKRALELINRTNQFNTSGRRWDLPELDAFLRSGGGLVAFDVSDAFTDYGLVGVVLLRGHEIVQWVMSCRVLGYKVEQAVMATVVAQIRAEGRPAVTGALTHTDVNFPCRDLFAKCGFDRVNSLNGKELWSLPASRTVESPPHVTVAQKANGS